MLRAVVFYACSSSVRRASIRWLTRTSQSECRPPCHRREEDRERRATTVPLFAIGGRLEQIEKKRGFFVLCYWCSRVLLIRSFEETKTRHSLCSYVQIENMVTYSIKQLMGLCSDYALDAPIQKILFSLDLWVPKAARVRFYGRTSTITLFIR